MDLTKADIIKLVQETVNAMGLEPPDEVVNRHVPQIITVGDVVSTGRFDGQLYYGPISPPHEAETGITEDNLGFKPSSDSADSDAEIWDLADFSDSTRIGHFAGYSPRKRPVYIIDAAGGLGAPQYVAQFFGGVAANSAAWTYIFSATAI